MRRSFHAPGLFILTLLLWCANPLETSLAQETVNYASVRGSVTDSTGALVFNATVTARQTETNLTSATATDQDGRFRFPYLKPGPYEVIVRQPGFADAIRPVTLTVGAAIELSISLNVASVETNVSVSEDAEVLEAARTQIAGTLTQTEIANLPVNGRNYLDIALLVPGVSPTNTASNQLFAETSAVPGQGISVNSQ